MDLALVSTTETGSQLVTLRALMAAAQSENRAINALVDTLARQVG